MADRNDQQPDATSNGQERSGVKLAIIGGGSLQCIGFIECVIAHPEILRGSTIVLMDVDEENLTRIYRISRRLFELADVNIRLEMTTSQEEALEDAHFVLIALRVGGLRARVLDETLPLLHDTIGHDVVGAGGFFGALRTAPVIAGIAAEMEKVAPKAFLLNYTIPSNIVIEAIAHSSGIRVIGLDEWPMPAVQHMVELAGLRAEALHPRKVGMSHANWTTEVWQEGEDILPRLVQWSKAYSEEHPDLTAENYEGVLLARLTAAYEAIPSHYMYYYYFPDIVLDFQRKRNKAPAEELMSTIPALIDHYTRAAQRMDTGMRRFPSTDTCIGMRALSVMRSILHDRGEEWVLSVPNNGAINFLADDRVVELPCRVDARGATPLTQGDGGLRLDMRGLIEALAEYEGATARVALWGKRQEAIRALAAHPLIMSYHKAQLLYATMAEAHKTYLPTRLFD